MKKIAGNILIILSIVCIEATIAWLIFGLLNQPENPNEDDRTTLIAIFLFAGVPGVLFILEVVIFICGKSLRNPAPKVISGPETKRRYMHSPILVIYLVTCICIAFLSGFGNKIKILPEMQTMALGLIIGQPQVLTQLLVALIPGIKLGTGLSSNIIMFVSSLLYFLIFLYPLYRIVTMDRLAEVTAYKKMKLLFILFAGVHILMAFVIVFLARA